MTIDVDYSPPSDFTLQPPYYRAASSVNLTCNLEGLEGDIFYNWTSTCSGNCFVVSGRSSRLMSKWALQSTDSGFHTCTVSDIGGCVGNATIEMKVVGERLLGAFCAGLLNIMHIYSDGIKHFKLLLCVCVWGGLAQPSHYVHKRPAMRGKNYYATYSGKGKYHKCEYYETDSIMGRHAKLNHTAREFFF